ncbi:MAG: hypothetical protein O7F09_03205, partial [Chloroflexi bacterium]|nr:hypothetical protein [Chloroflexota bacterium]
AGNPGSLHLPSMRSDERGLIPTLEQRWDAPPPLCQRVLLLGELLSVICATMVSLPAQPPNGVVVGRGDAP